MEMKQISETTLKITISMEDLEERGMELKDFLIPQEKTEEFLEYFTENGKPVFAFENTKTIDMGQLTYQTDQVGDMIEKLRECARGWS